MGRLVNLTVEQKSVYLIILNASMVMRSVGKTLKDRKRQIAFKRTLHDAISSLMDAMKDRRFTNELLRGQISRLASDTGTSFGQAQKAINVILKYYYYLTPEIRCDPALEREFDCPVDSKIQDDLKLQRVPLSRLSLDVYEDIQNRIQKKMRSASRLSYDRRVWDEPMVRESGWGGKG